MNRPNSRLSRVLRARATRPRSQNRTLMKDRTREPEVHSEGPGIRDPGRNGLAVAHRAHDRKNEENVMLHIVATPVRMMRISTISLAACALLTGCTSSDVFDFFTDDAYEDQRNEDVRDYSSRLELASYPALESDGNHVRSTSDNNIVNEDGFGAEFGYGNGVTFVTSNDKDEPEPANGDRSDIGALDDPGPVIVLLAPTEGERLNLDRTIPVRWEYSASTSRKLRIQARNDYWGALYIEHSTKNDGYYAWKPDTRFSAGLWTILITDVKDQRIWGESASFELVETTPQATLAFSSPSTHEGYFEGDSVTLRWKSTGDIERVRIEWLYHSRVNRVVAESSVNTGTYRWKFPTGARTGNSDHYFRITAIGMTGVSVTSVELSGPTY